MGERAGRGDARGERGYDNIAAATTCQQGYAHGYTIGYLGATDPTTEEFLRIIGDECGASRGLTALFNCTHAFGHVVARRNEGDVGRAIEVCERVAYGSLPGARVRPLIPSTAPPIQQGSRHQCLYGLYMEVGMLDLARGDRTRDNCGTATSPESRKACYAYLSARVGALEGNLEAAADACMQLAPRGEPRTSCVKTFSLGLDAAKRCELLSGRAERAACREVIALRDRQDELLRFSDGDPDAFGSVRIAPEPGVEPPATGPDEPAAPPAG